MKIKRKIDKSLLEVCYCVERYYFMLYHGQCLLKTDIIETIANNSSEREDLVGLFSTVPDVINQHTKFPPNVEMLFIERFH